MLKRILKRIGGIPPIKIALKSPKTILYRPRLLDHPEHMSFGHRVTVREHSWLATIPKYAGQDFSPHLLIGDGVYIGRHVCITCVDRVEISDGCVLSEHVYIADSAHGVDPRGGPIMEQALVSRGPVKIGARTFIGYGARVLPGVELGEHCVVGANAVVTRSFPAYSMLAGVPAKRIKYFDTKLGTWEAINE